MQFIVDPVILHIISFCMALLFMTAAIHKLQAPAAFRASMQAYELLPEALVAVMSMALIALELLSALLVLAPASRFIGFGLLAMLLLVYTTGISINLYRGRTDLDCGCHGPAAIQPISWWLVLRNLVLLGLVLWGLMVLAVGPLTGRHLNWLDLFTIIFGVLAASGLYLGSNQLLAQAPRVATLRHTA